MRKRVKLENEQLAMQGVPLNKEEPSFAEHKKIKPDEEENVKPEVSEGQVSIFDDSLGETLIDESLARERLREALETQKPKKKRKSLITNLIFLVINVCLLAYFINGSIQDLKGTPFRDILANQGDKLWWLMGGVGLFLIMFFADTMIFYCLIKRSTGKGRLLVSYQASATGKYFENITPFAVGGQPSQIVVLTKAGLSPGIATSIPIIRLIIYNVVYSVVILSFLIFGIPQIPSSSGILGLLTVFVKLFSYLGIIVTALMSLIVILIGSGKIVGRSLIRWIVRLGYKLHIVKDYRKSYNKFMNQVLEYQSSIQYLRKNKGTLVACILFSILEVVAFFSIPFTIVLAFGSETTMAPSLLMWIICITQFVMCQMAAVVVPLPGGTGMMEIAFTALFCHSSLLGLKYYSLGLLAWRFLTYYLTILQGFIVSTTDSVVRMIKTKKQNKKEEITNKTEEINS